MNIQNKTHRQQEYLDRKVAEFSQKFPPTFYVTHWRHTAGEEGVPSISEARNSEMEQFLRKTILDSFEIK